MMGAVDRRASPAVGMTRGGRMRSDLRCAGKVGAVGFAAVVVLVGGQVQSAQAATNQPGRPGGCIRQGTVLESECPVMPDAADRYGRSLRTESTHPAPAAFARPRTERA